MEDVRERFATKVEEGEGGCIVWTACRDAQGYGRFAFDGHTRMAHRVAWTLAHGPIPDGLSVLHRCDRRACVNVAHLFLGTQIDNMADCSAKGRNSRGSTHPHAKLTEDEARAIRAARGKVTQRELAARYGVSTATVQNIHRGLIWRHV